MSEIPSMIGQARLQRTAAGLQIVIPVYQSWFHFLMTPVSACLAIFILRGIGDLPPSCSLLLWAMVATPWVRWVWQSAGRQVLTLNRISLRVRYDLLGLGWNQDYFVDQIFELRYSPIVTIPAKNPAPDNGPSYGWIRFECGQTSQRLAGRFSETEARDLIAVIENHAAAPLSSCNAKANQRREHGAAAEETHRGTGGFILFSWIGGMPYCIAMFSESAAARFLTGTIWAGMIAIGIVAEAGYRYRFTPAGLQISTLGIRRKFIPVDQIIHYEQARWMSTDGRNVPFLPGQRCFCWGGPGLRITTLDGTIYLGHKWPEKIVGELDRMKGLPSSAQSANLKTFSAAASLSSSEIRHE